MEELSKKGIAYTIDDRRTIVSCDPCYELLDDDLGTIRLDDGMYDFQGMAVDSMLIHGSGVCEAATNAGKTTIGAAVIKALDRRTLWIVHRVTLAHQSRAELSERLGQPVGLIGDGIWEPEKVTVAMIQTLAPLVKKVDERAAWVRSAEVLFGDESHHLESDQWYDTFDAIAAAHRYGMTATVPEGPTGLLLEAQTGRTIFRVTQNELIERGVSVPPRIWVCTIKQPENFSGGTFAETYNLAIVHNKYRNEQIRSCVAQLVRDKKPGIVLTRRVDHCKNLHKMIQSSGLKVQWITSELGQHERNQYLRGLSTGTTDCIVAIDSILGEGVDAGDIRFVLNATGGKGGKEKCDTVGSQLVQFIGRGCRRAKASKFLPAKTHFDYIDFVDAMCKDTREWSTARLDTIINAGHGQRIGHWHDYSRAA